MFRRRSSARASSFCELLLSKERAALHDGGVEDTALYQVPALLTAVHGVRAEAVEDLAHHRSAAVDRTATVGDVDAVAVWFHGERGHSSDFLRLILRRIVAAL